MKTIKRGLAFLLVAMLVLGMVVFADSDPAEQPAEPPAEAALKRPAEMKAVWLSAGQDFDPAASETDCKAQLDAALDAIENFEMNAVLLPVNGESGGYFPSESWPSSAGFDLVQYVLDGAKSRSLFVYAVADAGWGVGSDGSYKKQESLSAAAVQAQCRAVEELAANYDLDGVYLQNYCNRPGPASMALYRTEGASMGFENWVRECTTSLVVNASQTVKEKRPQALFGLLAEPVWANQSTDPAGSATAADYEMLTDGNLDLNAVFALGKIDDILVKCPGSLGDKALNFETVLGWWGSAAKQHNATVTACVYNQKLGGDGAGWKAPDQVMRQIIKTRETPGCKGAAFASLSALSENRSGATDVLMRYYKNEILEQDILTDLSMSQPEKRSYTTREPQAIFYGASDPNFPLKINGTELDRNGEGVFSIEMPLEPGLNTFTFEHKEKSITYKITREVVIIQSVSPAGSMTVEGGTQIGVSVMAYSGSAVTASLGGVSVQLTEEELVTDSADGNTSSYAPFKGSITVPAGQENVQDIGSIAVSATWQGITQSGGGAHVYVAALPQQAPVISGEKGSLAQITASQARTYPGGVLTNDPNGSCFPLPAGTVDYIVSDKLTYDDDYGHGEYYILGCGLRVRAQDVTDLGEAEWEMSSLSGASSWADGQYVYVSFARPGRKTAYTVEFPGTSYSGNGGAQGFDAGQMRVTLRDTSLDTGAPEMAGNNLLSGVELAQSGNDTVINFNLQRAGSFMGYRAYYDGDNLVFRFNQIPGGIAGAKIYIDPGHGGVDGGKSIPGMYSEKNLNADLAGRVAQILRDRGAVVQVTDTSGTVSLDSRVSMSQNFGPHLFVSLHHNSGSSSAKGTEAYYFNPYSRSLAANLSAGVSGALETRNRGAKHGAYRVTTHMEFPAVLMECGFLTNPDELSKIQSDDYKNAMAVSIANAIESTINSMH